MLEQTGLYKNRGKLDKNGKRERVPLPGITTNTTPNELEAIIENAISNMSNLSKS